MTGATQTTRRIGGFGAAPQIVAALLVFGLFGAMAIEPTRELLEQKDHIASVDQDLRDLRRSNRRLEARIERLKDPDYLEQRARQQIGLVRPGETPYVVMPPSRKQRARKAPEPPAPVQQEPGFVEGFLAFMGVL